MVLYRKYRPQILQDLDLSDVREKLTKTLLSSYRPHAYLFAGPKGTGKTSAARIVAKILNCENPTSSRGAGLRGASVEPCNVCENCISITEGRHMDVMEIDAASNRGIDEIRDLREKIKLAPISGKYKVYIIDEVHMLTNDAFNALLKTLEEPPSHAIFILATTEADKLPDTIVSRSTRFNFQKAKASEILHALNRVIIGEKIKIDEPAKMLLAEAADGSFRDVTKLLEQAINQKFTSSEDIAVMLGWNTINPEKFLKRLYDGEIKELLTEIESMGQKGTDFRLFTAAVLNILHSLMLENFGIKQENLSENMKNSLALAEINSLIKLFSQVYADLKFASRPELPLETAVVEWNSRNKTDKNK